MPWGLLITLLVGLALAWAAGVAYTVRLLRVPPRRGYAWALARGAPADPSELVHSNPPVRGLEYVEWMFGSRGLTLPVWEISGLARNGPTVIITHGWADSRIVMLSRVAGFAPMASKIVVWDLAAHGTAPGRCALGTREVDDLLALIEIVAASEKVVLYGFSLGAGISIAAAARRPERVAAIIAEAPYRIPPTPARNVLRLRGVPHVTTLSVALGLVGLALGHGAAWYIAAVKRSRGGDPRFDRAVLAASIPRSIPVLVVHGDDDPVCPLEDGREIARACGGRLAAIAGGGHNNLWSEDHLMVQTREAAREFLAALHPVETQAERMTA